MKINISLITLGCDKNTVDSEAILALFNDENEYKITSNLSEANLIIINTCGFILDAKKEAIDTIFSCINNYPNAKIVVTGCLVERYKKELEEEFTKDEVSLFISLKEYKNMGRLISNLFNKENTKEFDVFERMRSTKKYSAFLKISEGCSNFCGFCAIPFIRGKYHSFDFNSLINEAKKMASEGVKELIIISQDTGRYGKDFKDKNINLVTLLKELEKIEGIEFIRLLYLYPDEVSDELIDFINNSEKMTHYFDIPIQHASNKILKSMLRKDSKEDILSLYKRIKEKVKDPIFRTTLIVGYPQESEEDIEELKEFIKEIKFNHLGVFTYSKEEGTYGALLKEQVEEEIKEKRKNEIMELQAHISYELNKQEIGKTYKALIVKKVSDSEYYLRCGYNAPDDIDGNIILDSKGKIYNEGDIVNIKITNSFVYDLLAEVI